MQGRRGRVSNSYVRCRHGAEAPRVSDGQCKRVRTHRRCQLNNGRGTYHTARLILPNEAERITVGIAGLRPVQYHTHALPCAFQGLVSACDCDWRVVYRHYRDDCASRGTEASGIGDRQRKGVRAHRQRQLNNGRGAYHIARPIFPDRAEHISVGIAGLGSIQLHGCPARSGGVNRLVRTGVCHWRVVYCHYSDNGARHGTEAPWIGDRQRKCVHAHRQRQLNNGRGAHHIARLILPNKAEHILVRIAGLGSVQLHGCPAWAGGVNRLVHTCVGHWRTIGHYVTRHSAEKDL